MRICSCLPTDLLNGPNLITQGSPTSGTGLRPVRNLATSRACLGSASWLPRPRPRHQAPGSQPVVPKEVGDRCHKAPLRVSSRESPLSQQCFLFYICPPRARCWPRLASVSCTELDGWEWKFWGGSLSTCFLPTRSKFTLPSDITMLEFIFFLISYLCLLNSSLITVRYKKWHWKISTPFS